MVAAWVKDLNDVAMTGLTKVSGHDPGGMPALDVKIEAPAIPDRKEPEKPEKAERLADKFKTIDSLDGLQAYAQAAAYDKHKKRGRQNDAHGSF